MVVEGQGVPDSPASEEQRIKEVAVGCGVATTAVVGRTQEKGDRDSLESGLLAEPKEFGKQVGERPAEGLGASQVVSRHEVRPRKLRCEAVVGVFDDRPWILVARR